MSNLSAFFKYHMLIWSLIFISASVLFYSITSLAIGKKNLGNTVQNTYWHSVITKVNGVNDSSLTAKVIKILKPKKIDIVGSAIYGRNGEPPGGQKWLVLQIEMKPFTLTESVSGNEINIIESSKKMHEVIGISKVENDPSYTFLEDIGKPDFTGRRPLGIGIMDANNKIFLFLIRDDKGYIKLLFQNTESFNIYFLFTVPVDSKNLQLQIDGLPLIKISN